LNDKTRLHKQTVIRDGCAYIQIT